MRLKIVVKRDSLKEKDGEAALTNEKNVITFVSVTKGYVSSSKSDFNDTKSKSRWSYEKEYDVTIEGNTITLTSVSSEHSLMIIELNVKSITGSTILCDYKRTRVRKEGDPDISEIKEEPADWQAFLIR